MRIPMELLIFQQVTYIHPLALLVKIIYFKCVLVALINLGMEEGGTQLQQQRY
jgi:hypothetical protein